MKLSMVQGGFYNGACTVIPYPTVEVKHIWQVYATSELKMKLFCFCIICVMVWFFIAVENRYLNLLAVLKFAKSQMELKWANTTSNNSWPIFPHHAHNQADFENLFINGRGFIYLGISKISFTF